MENQECEIEIRQIFEPEDFNEQMTAGEIAAERKLFEQAAHNK
jgi:hypothetical protein